MVIDSVTVMSRVTLAKPVGVPLGVRMGTTLTAVHVTELTLPVATLPVGTVPQLDGMSKHTESRLSLWKQKS
jgi:predicted dienelactone hydrolase